MVVRHNAGVRPPWLITVIMGPSGVGKSSVAVALAARYGVPLGEVDDIVTAVRTLTTPREQPVLHYAATHPEIFSWPAERIADHHERLTEVLRPAIEAVIADHVEFDAPMVLEGDYLSPDIVSGFGDEVRAVLLHEPDVERIVANYACREPDADHALRAQVSVELGRRWAKRAEHLGVPVVMPRPWRDGADRTDAALSRARPARR